MFLTKYSGQRSQDVRTTLFPGLPAMNDFAPTSSVRGVWFSDSDQRWAENNPKPKVSNP